MKHKRFWIAASIIACIVIIGFVLSVPHTHDVKTSLNKNDATAVPVVALHDSFKKGVHTITGSIEVPNACTLATANATLSGDASSTQKIVVQVSVPADEGMCLQVPTKINFGVKLSAPAHLPIEATINGSEASTTLL